ncbi:MAG: hypothetical protein K8R11_07615 [Methanococcoides sp.]|nr:hypothetical protein [Methanococcoides sp.]
MEIYKHKTSGKYFIFIKHDRIDFAYFVNNRAKVLPLELFDFEEYPLDNSKEYFLRHKLVTNEQVKCYEQYLEFRFQDEKAREKARFESIYEGLSIEEILKLLIREKSKRSKKQE